MVNNEEMLMPYLIRHYSLFSDVVILENNSTDNGINIAKSMGAKIISYNIPDEKDNQWIVDIKNKCWEGNSSDWVIIVDADEFVYHPNLVNILSTTDATIITPKWCNMFSDHIPTTNGQIYDEICYGVEYEDGGKTNIFKPKEITEINYDVGCHRCNPKGNIIYRDTEIKTLHMRYFSIDYVMERNAIAAKRLSQRNRDNGWSYHYYFSRERVEEFFNSSNKDIKKIT